MKARAAVEPGKILAWEAEYGSITPRDAVFFHFGWDRLWTDRPHEFLADWPGLSHAASELMVERGVRIVGPFGDGPVGPRHRRFYDRIRSHWHYCRAWRLGRSDLCSAASHGS